MISDYSEYYPQVVWNFSQKLAKNDQKLYLVDNFRLKPIKIDQF